MILDKEISVKDYKGELMGVGLTMKTLALEAFEGSKIDDPNQSELAGIAMKKIYNDEPLNESEKAIAKAVMMAVYHPKYLAYISKEFKNGDINKEG
jgi:hypothetical protein